MASNLDRYKRDLDALILSGQSLLIAIIVESGAEQGKKALRKQLGDQADQILATLPLFSEEYESWYSESKALVRRLIPDRLSDFVRHCEEPKVRKHIDYENYCIEDYLQGLIVTRGINKERVVGRDAAIPHFRQQLAIVRSLKHRMESSLFEIRQLPRRTFLTRSWKPQRVWPRVDCCARPVL